MAVQSPVSFMLVQHLQNDVCYGVVLRDIMTRDVKQMHFEEKTVSHISKRVGTPLVIVAFVTMLVTGCGSSSSSSSATKTTGANSATTALATNTTIGTSAAPNPPIGGGATSINRKALFMQMCTRGAGHPICACAWDKIEKELPDGFFKDNKGTETLTPEVRKKILDATMSCMQGGPSS